jgi:serine phosphatase RsbU (regulator of sigma subunit)
LNILSIDKQTNTLVITRNNPAPALLALHDSIRILNEESRAVGLYRDTRPVICEVNLEPGLTAVVYTDGLVHAGDRYGQPMDVCASLLELLEEEDPSPQMIADSLLEQALRLDQGRPADDVSVVVLRVSNFQGDAVRRMSVRLPLDIT